jgi:hypothetical protein
LSAVAAIACVTGFVVVRSERGDAWPREGFRVHEPLFSCLATADTGALTVDIGVHGCFGGSTLTVGVKWNADHGEIAVREERTLDAKPSWRFVTRDEARATALQFVRATSVHAPASLSGSTTRVDAALRGACDGGAIQELALEGSAVMSLPARDVLTLVESSGVEVLERVVIVHNDDGSADRWVALGGGRVLARPYGGVELVVIEDATPNIVARVLAPRNPHPLDYVAAEMIASLAWDVRERGVR